MILVTVIKTQNKEVNMEYPRMTATAISRDEVFIKLGTNEGIENWIKNTLQDVADELSLRTLILSRCLPMRITIKGHLML